MKKKVSITRFIQITTQIFALIWVSTSYILAGYSTICLGDPFPITDLSIQAIVVLLGNNAIKGIENIAEHNDSKLFGTSNKKETNNDDRGI